MGQKGDLLPKGFDEMEKFCDEDWGFTGAVHSNIKCGGSRFLEVDAGNLYAVHPERFRLYDLTPCEYECAKDRISSLTMTPGEGVGMPDSFRWLMASSGHGQELVLITNRDNNHSEDRVNFGRSADVQPSLYIVVLDSVSRGTFRRFLPLTHQFLKDANMAMAGINHKSFGFSRYHAASAGSTIAHIFPMLFGGLRFCDIVASTLEHGQSSKMTANISHFLQECRAFPHGVLSMLKKFGYKSGYLGKAMGPMHSILKNFDWDYIAPDFQSLFNWSLEGRERRCVGRSRYIDLLLDWSMELFNLYRDEPFFLYNHFEGAHTGPEAVEYIDVALRDHLSNVMRKHPNTTIVLMGDHGYRSKACDYRSPLLHIILPQTLLTARPDVAKALTANQGRLTSVWDMFISLQHLANLKQPSSMLRDGFNALGIEMLVAAPFLRQHYMHEVSLQGSFAPRSLFESMPEERSCEEAGISKLMCKLGMSPDRVFCMSFENLTEPTRRHFATRNDSYVNDQLCNLMGPWLWPLLDLGLNRYLVDSSNSSCERFSLHAIEFIEAGGEDFSDDDSTVFKYFHVRFSVNEGQPRRVFDATVAARSDLQAAHFLFASQVTRYEKYEWCTPAGIPAEFCVCQESWD